MKTLPLALVLLAACSHSQAPEPTQHEEPTPEPAPVVSAVDAAVVAPTVTVDAAVAAAEPAPTPDAAPPAPSYDYSSLPPSKTWPFYQWDEAQVVTYNLNRPGPGSHLFAFREDKGWNPRIATKVGITKAQAKKAIGFASQTLGGMDVSKCPYPRHAVVLLSQGVPVASINVCFECGDILVWPAWKKDPNWEDKKYKMYGKLMKRYDKVFPKWERFFAKDLGIPTDWKQIGGQPATKAVQ